MRPSDSSPMTIPLVSQIGPSKAFIRGLPIQTAYSVTYVVVVRLVSSCIYAMRISRSFTSVLFPLTYTFFAQAAILPATLSLRNGTSLGLPVVSVPGTSPTTGVPWSPVSLSSRQMILAFIEKGRSIPENEVKDTLLDADQAIAELSRNYPTQRITNDRFEYRRPNGNMLIAIQTNPGEMITWQELSRILHGLFQYMTAATGAQEGAETHYQTLEFEVEARGQEKPNIAYGLVWYFDPAGNEIQKRVMLPLRNHTSQRPSNETAMRVPSITLVLPVTPDEPTIFSIPQTSLRLSIYYFGPSIPGRSVEATLQGAMAFVRPYLNGRTETHPIENDAFRWILPLSRKAGIPVAVTVFSYDRHLISWRQLFDVLFGLFSFATTFGTDLPKSHYQVLGFRILDQNAVTPIGVGTISYYEPGTAQLTRRGTTINDGAILRSPSVSNAPSLDLVSTPIAYKVADTDITLTFTYLGDTPIPPLEINAALTLTRARISPSVRRTPNSDISERFRDISADSRLSTNLLVYANKEITYKEADQILMGLARFCQEDQAHDRVLVYEIDIVGEGRGRVGFGTLLYVPDRSDVATLK